MPLRGLLKALGAPTDLVPRDALPGTEPAVLDLPSGDRLAVMISWEVFFGGRARDGVSHGGTLLLNPTNGSSYTGTILQTQQIASSRLRALENGRWVAQVAPTGFSAFVTPSGDVLDRTGISEQAVRYRHRPAARRPHDLRPHRGEAGRRRGDRRGRRRPAPRPVGPPAPGAGPRHRERRGRRPGWRRGRRRRGRGGRRRPRAGPVGDERLVEPGRLGPPRSCQRIVHSAVASDADSTEPAWRRGRRAGMSVRSASPERRLATEVSRPRAGPSPGRR